jgi:hypothetical protein
MIKKIDIPNPKLAEDVLKIQIPSYKVEAELIDFYEIPPLKDTIDTLQQRINRTIIRRLILNYRFLLA